MTRASVSKIITHRQVVRAASGAPEWRNIAGMQKLVNLKRNNGHRNQCLRNMREDVLAVGHTDAILPCRYAGANRAIAAALVLGGLPDDLAETCRLALLAETDGGA